MDLKGHQSFCTHFTASQAHQQCYRSRELTCGSLVFKRANKILWKFTELRIAARRSHHACRVGQIQVECVTIVRKVTLIRPRGKVNHCQRSSFPQHTCSNHQWQAQAQPPCHLRTASLTISRLHATIYDYSSMRSNTFLVLDPSFGWVCQCSGSIRQRGKRCPLAGGSGVIQFFSFFFFAGSSSRKLW